MRTKSKKNRMRKDFGSEGSKVDNEDLTLRNQTYYDIYMLFKDNTSKN